jgi:hypothetical protein
MRTAVKLCDDPPTADLIFGRPVQMTSDETGRIALFSSGEIVAYRLRHRRQSRLFVFRTLMVDDRLAASVPGVGPRVQLLMVARSAGRVRLMVRLFAYLVRTGRDPQALSDGFYVRVGVVLGGRLPVQKVLLSLLSRPPLPGQ